MPYKWAVYTLILIYLCSIYRKANGTRIYYFYKDACPHCVKLKPSWNLFTSACAWSLTVPVEINCDNKKNQSIRDNFHAKTVPHIVKVINDVREVYSGNRTSEDILEWSKKPISDGDN